MRGFKVLSRVPPSLNHGATRSCKQTLGKGNPNFHNVHAQKGLNWHEKHGMWSDFDPYTRSGSSPLHVQAALDYFSKDKLGCFRQSVNKDVGSGITNGQRECVSKQFMTDSIYKTFQMFKAAYP